MTRPRSPLPVLVSTVFLGLPACGSEPGPPPKVVHEDAGVQVRRVATKWGDTVEEGGFLQDDPNGVLQFRVVTARTLTIGEGRACKLHVERDETFATKLGSFHCKTKGDLEGTAAFGWNAGEAEVRLDLPPANLRRACQEAGFPVSVKALPAAVMLLVLRSDRLIGKTSALDHTVLLPQQ